MHVTRAMRGADCGTDHHMVRSKISLHIRRKIKKSAKHLIKRFNVTSLANPDHATTFSNSISTAMDNLPPFGEDVEAEWSILRDAVTRTATDCLGFLKRNHADWFDENDPLITDLLEKRRTAHAAMLINPLSESKRQDYNKACSTLQRNLRIVKNDWFNRKAEELQSYADQKDYKAFYDAVKQIYGPTRSVISPLMDLDGQTILTDRTSIARRWSQHFDILLNHDSHVEDSSLNVIEPRATIDGMAEAPTQEEVDRAIYEMRNNKSPGPDGIPAEIFKHGGQKLSERLRNLFALIWSTETIPQQFKDANIIPIYKNKGQRSSCDNYRGISLLSVAGKILARIVLRRIIDNISDEVLSESQCGFRSGRSTIDMIFSARQIQEKCREQGQPLFMIFIDLTKAFDTVNREGLWRLLKIFGCHDKIINIVRQLHDGMTGGVNIGGATSDRFFVRNGLKQGCVLAATLFALFYAAVLNEALKDCPDGIFIRFRTGKLFKLSRLRSASKVMETVIQELLYADDCALVANSENALQGIATKFAASAKRFGLRVNLAKTEVMYQPPDGQAHLNPTIMIEGTTLKSVKQFTYLGSTLSTDATIDIEVNNRINKASAAFGRLSTRVWNQHDLRLQTKINVYNAVVLSALLYGSETWTCYRRHIRLLESFHMRRLRAIVGIRWQDLISNVKVLEMTQSTSIQCWIIRAQLRWVGHVIRLPSGRLPQQILYSELSHGKRARGAPKKRFKDNLKANLKACNIDPDRLEEITCDRSLWRRSIRSGVTLYEEERVRTLEHNRQQKKSGVINRPINDIACAQCGRVCHSRIGLWSHMRSKHPTHTLNT